MPSEKPSKPYSDFPLYPHPNGQWAKKIRGKMYYFGVWEDWKSALDEYLKQKDELHSGIEVSSRGSRSFVDPSDDLLVAELCNEFLNAKLLQLESGELSTRTFKDYKRVATIIVNYFGNRRAVLSITTQEFNSFRAFLADGRGVVALGNMVRMSRIVFRYASEARLTTSSVYFGPMFKEPSKVAKRRDRQLKPKRMFAAKQLRKIIKNSDGQLKAMVLLGINCGYGNTDCSSLPSVLPIEGRFINFPRPKTAVERTAYLWDETIQALDSVGPSHHETFFRTERGLLLVRTRVDGANIDRVVPKMKQLLRDSGIDQNGLNFYALRHTFETIASGTKDQQAVDLVMGHTDDSMAAVYREDFDLARVKSVCKYVRKWLFTKSSKTQ